MHTWISVYINRYLRIYIYVFIDEYVYICILKEALDCRSSQAITHPYAVNEI
jgi:hypothetical protein